MKRKLFATAFPLFILLNVLSINACSERAEVINCFPEQPINVTLNLNLPAYFALQSVGGWMYIDEQQAGTRGLILVRTTNGFKAYDRNAPHICPDANTTLSVDSNIKIVCPKDGAEWILLTGEPTKVATISPKTYRYSFDQGTGILSIFY